MVIIIYTAWKTHYTWTLITEWFRCYSTGVRTYIYSTSGTTRTFSSCSFMVEYTQRQHKSWIGKNECSLALSKSCLHHTCAGLPISNRDGCGWNQATTTKHIVWTEFELQTVYEIFTKYFILTGRCVASWGLISVEQASGVGQHPKRVSSQQASAMKSFLQVLHRNVTDLYLR